MTRSSLWRWVLLAGGALAVVALSSLLGYRGVDWNEVFHWPADGEPRNVFWTLRAPRARLGALAGAGLALSGVILQALFRNPLATPYTLGVASGASLGAALGFLLGLGGAWMGVPKLTLLAFLGAMGALGAVYLMARLSGVRDMTRLLLAGVCVSYMASAGVLLITHLANQPVTNDIVIWMMGSLAVAPAGAELEILLVLAGVLALGLLWRRDLDLLSMGERLAASRGVSVERRVWACLLAVGLLTTVIVSRCGPIGFVGLIVPHLARGLVGVRAAPLLIASTLMGAAFLSLCDGLARFASPRIELPVGVLTNIVGAAFFFYLLASPRAGAPERET